METTPVLASPVVAIQVVGRNRNDRRWVRSIRDWKRNSLHPDLAKLVGPVSYFSSLDEAIKVVENRPSILLAAGFRPQEVSDRFSVRDALASGCSVILTHPTARYQRRKPSASILHTRAFVGVRETDVLETFRKMILGARTSLIGSLRKLQDVREVSSYLQLRYEIWKKSGYMRADQIPKCCKFEVDYTDRTAIPIALFNQNGIPIGCARLVREYGHEATEYSKMIRGLIDNSDDPQLHKNFQCPHRVTHPFDVLQEFRGFRSYFRSLLIRGISVAEVSRVIVDPRYRRQGIAEVLVDSLVEVAKPLGIKTLFLACGKDVQNLYEKCGFSPVEGLQSDKFIDIQKPSLVMDRQI